MVSVMMDECMKWEDGSNVKTAVQHHGTYPVDRNIYRQLL
jgi:hypothetical protein